MKLLSSFAGSSRWLSCSAFATSVLGGLGGTLLVVLLNQALQSTPEQLPRLGAVFAALSLATLLLRWLSRCQFAEISQRTLADLRSRLSRSFASASYPELEARGHTVYLGVLTEDVVTLSQLFVALPRFAMQGSVIAGCLVYLALLSEAAFGLALVAVAVGALGRYFGNRRATEELRRARASEDELYGHFRALLSGAKELKLNARRRDEFLSEVLDDQIERVRAQRSRGERRHVAAVSWSVFLFYVVIGGVVFGLGALGGVDDPVRSGYALIVVYMMLPVHALMEAIPQLGRAQVALERVRAALQGEAGGHTLPRTPAIAPAPPPAARFEQLELRAVTHRYRRESEDGEFVLGPLDLTLRRGEIVFLIGANGSGKTTLAKVLVGLYEPETGERLLNGEPVSAASAEAYRQSFSAVFSDFYLFDSLLGLDGGGPSRDGAGAARLDQRARALLEALDLKHKLNVERGEFSTTELSRGQQKRLALVVAWLEDRPVLVFDEWAADQDPSYKQVFYSQVLPELKARGKAVLVISHDDRYFHLADRCLELEAGRLGTLPEARRAAVRSAPTPARWGQLEAAEHALQNGAES
jgi:putative ATP-binding cassette transporter